MRNLIIIFGIMLSACAQTPQPQPKVVNYETKGNLESNFPLGCVGLEQVDNRHTPADIYPAVTRCITSGDYNKASQLYGLAGVYGRFDMLRVRDSTAHQAVLVLQSNNFGSLSDEQREAFKTSTLDRLAQGSKQLSDLCSKIKSIGPPNYHPRYMIQHGMGAFGGSSGSGIKSDFDPVQSWKDSLSGYLHCP
ncbi:hypothetical protein [Paraperlucidibaca sp.]|uniref:hypothetical protein n=1 Tax=Paraperlucidibaca sp. TaxID=2708021 RepID=UPI0030F371F3